MSSSHNLRAKLIRLAHSTPVRSESRRALLQVLADSRGGRPTVAAYYGDIPGVPKTREQEAYDALWHRLRSYHAKPNKRKLTEELGKLLLTHKTPQKAVLQWFRDHGFKDPKDYEYDLGKEAQILQRLLLDMAASTSLNRKDTVEALESIMEANDYDIGAGELFQRWLATQPRTDRATQHSHKQVVMPWIRAEFFGR